MEEERVEEEESGLRPFRTEFGSVVRRVRALRCCCGALVKYTTLANEPPICINTAHQQLFNLGHRESELTSTAMCEMYSVYFGR